MKIKSDQMYLLYNKENEHASWYCLNFSNPNEYNLISLMKPQEMAFWNM